MFLLRRKETVSLGVLGSKQTGRGSRGKKFAKSAAMKAVLSPMIAGRSTYVDFMKRGVSPKLQKG
jgi:hypothetical protein